MAEFDTAALRAEHAPGFGAGCTTCWAMVAPCEVVRMADALDAVRAERDQWQERHKCVDGYYRHQLGRNERLTEHRNKAEAELARLTAACQDGNRGCCVDGTCCACCSRVEVAEAALANRTAECDTFKKAHSRAVSGEHDWMMRCRTAEGRVAELTAVRIPEYASAADAPSGVDGTPGWAYCEDGYCIRCGNGRWKHHAPDCELRDLLDGVDAARLDCLHRVNEAQADRDEWHAIAEHRLAMWKCTLEDTRKMQKQIDTADSVRTNLEKRLALAEFKVRCFIREHRKAEAERPTCFDTHGCETRGCYGESVGVPGCQGAAVLRARGGDV